MHLNFLTKIKVNIHKKMIFHKLRCVSSDQAITKSNTKTVIIERKHDDKKDEIQYLVIMRDLQAIFQRLFIFDQELDKELQHSTRDIESHDVCNYKRLTTNPVYSDHVQRPTRSTETAEDVQFYFRFYL